MRAQVKNSKKARPVGPFWVPVKAESGTVLQGTEWRGMWTPQLRSVCPMALTESCYVNLILTLERAWTSAANWVKILLNIQKQMTILRDSPTISGFIGCVLGAMLLFSQVFSL